MIKETYFILIRSLCFPRCILAVLYSRMDIYVSLKSSCFSGLGLGRPIVIKGSSLSIKRSAVAHALLRLQGRRGF